MDHGMAHFHARRVAVCQDAAGLALQHGQQRARVVQVGIVHEQRGGELAFQVLSSSQGFLNAFAMAVAANPAITAASSDGDLEFTVITVWNDLAGVR